MKSYFLIMFAAMIVHACTSPQRQTEIVDSLKTVDSVISDKTNTPTIFKGLYTFGNEVNTFRDCTTNGSVYWVNDSIASLREPYEKTSRFPSYPYESVYTEVKGYLSGKTSLGYASEYENVLVVTEIIKVEAKNFRTDCYNYEFIALGNEPFWSVDIMPDERRIVFKNAGQEKAYEFIYAPASVAGGIYRYEAISPSNDKILVVIKEERCSDGMSDRQYNYSTEVTFKGVKYKGCAIKKGDILTE